MVLIDASVLVYAHRRDSLNHIAYRRWLEDCISSDQAYGMSDLVLSGFLRIVTHPRIFRLPTGWKTRFALLLKCEVSPIASS